MMPAGAGVFGKVTIEHRPVIYVEDIFVKPNIDDNYGEIRIGITNYGDTIGEEYSLEVSFLPKNYEGLEVGHLATVIHYVGIGKNEYRHYISMKDYRLWEPDSPYLYGAQVVLKKDQNVISTRTGTFGMKKFISDETTNPKGKFFFNNRPFVLRGANEMGHLQQCVMQGNLDLLTDDILIAKLLSYYTTSGSGRNL